jgi:hypothetical protein
MAAEGVGQGPKPLRLAKFLHIWFVIGTPASYPTRSLQASSLALPADLVLPLVAVLLVSVPVFLQAPLVRVAPLAAAMVTVPLVAVGVGLERFGRGPWQPLGPLLVGFSGSWLAGCLFWGWFRLHPVCHLPLEAFVLPLAVAGLGVRWRLAGAFYLASLAGTAATDAAIAATGLMDLWPQVLAAPLQEAPLLLRQAGETVLQLPNLVLVAVLAALLLQSCRWLWGRGTSGRLAAATLATTLAVDGLFLAAALLAPQLSGLI